MYSYKGCRGKTCVGSLKRVSAIPLQDTRRMYQDEVDMMEIELLGRERQERLAAERAAAETSGHAELGRMQVNGRSCREARTQRS